MQNQIKKSSTAVKRTLGKNLTLYIMEIKIRNQTHNRNRPEPWVNDFEALVIF